MAGLQPLLRLVTNQGLGSKSVTFVWKLMESLKDLEAERHGVTMGLANNDRILS